MSGGKSTIYQNNFLTWALTTTAVTRPTSWAIALYTDAIAKDAQNNPIYVQPTTESTTSNCPGYARQNATFGTASSGQIANSNDIAFTATGAWATVNYFAVIDNTGNMIYWSPLSTSRTLQVSGDKLDFAIGAITIQEK